MGESHQGAATQALVAARYSQGAAERLTRTIVTGLAPSMEGWNEVVVRRECSLLPVPEPVAPEVINKRLLEAAAR